MNLVELLQEHSEEIGEGKSVQAIKALEAKLDISFPNDFKEYLVELNYSEIFGDPIYGINSVETEFDIYAQNKHEEHFKYGFLLVFSNDIDGTIFIRPDNGAVYNASFVKPIASSFTEFVKKVLA